MTENIDIDQLINWVGIDGTRAALRLSKVLTLENLRDIAKKNSIDIPPNAKRDDIIDRILLKYDRRIRLSIVELKKMSSLELVDYLTKSGATSVEIVELLNKTNIPTIKLKSKKKLIEVAANSISGLGLYQRISNHDN